jgi:hypothetical protein
MKQHMPPDIPAALDYIFHELHADRHHALCAVCGSQYRQPARNVISDLSQRPPHQAA